jgi:hypothetical protein
VILKLRIVGELKTSLRSKYKQNWINHLERMENTRLPKNAFNTNLEGEEFVNAPGKGDNASMPEQVKRPNPCREMMMMIMMTLLLSACFKLS